MMRKYIMPVLLSALLISMLTGCGKKEETQTQVGMAPPVQETSAETQSTETETESQSGKTEKSKKETESEAETETDSVSESETSGEEDSDTETESVTEQSTEITTTVITTVSGNTVVTTAVETKAQQVTQQVTPQAETQIVTPVDDTPPDVPAETNIVTEPTVAQIDAPDPDAGAVTEPPTEEDNSTDDLSLTVNYQGYALTVGESAKDFIDAVKPNSEESAPSCYGNGENINYYYDDMTIYVWNENDNYMIYGIDIIASGIVSVKGMDIGSPATFDGEKIYDMGNGCNIMLIASGGNVVSISYNKNL